MAIKHVFLTVVILHLSLLLAACNLEAAPEQPDTLPTEATAPSPVPTTTQVQQPVDLQLDSVTATTLPLPEATITSPPGPAADHAELPAPDTSPTANIPFPQTFPDQHEVTIQQGRQLIINYDVIINNPGRGRVYLVVRDPAGETIWQLPVIQTESAAVEIEIQRSGTHEILAAVENLSGRYSLSYEQR
jgi:hypothetical protein